MNKLAVIALGGNALLRGDQSGTIEEQEQNTTDTLENLVHLIKDGYKISDGYLGISMSPASHIIKLRHKIVGRKSQGNITDIREIDRE